MYVIAIGLNHRTAPIEIREKLTFSEQEQTEALSKLKQTKSILEAVVVSTCNRMEIYAVVDQLHTGEHFIKKFLANWFSLEKEELCPFLYLKKDIDATEHLFKVIAGLDSMIIGETQILGQIRDGFMLAQQTNATGTMFNTLFKQAVTFAKKVHAKTGIGENAVSVSYAAVELTKRIFDRLDNKRVLLIGAGETSELTAIHLHAQGANSFAVVNRTYEAAQKLAEPFHGTAYTMEELSHALEQADIVISSTGAKTAIINKGFMDTVMKNRNSKPLFMIDIAVPRDIEPTINQIENVYLYDIDDLQGIVDANLEERKRIANEVFDWIDEEVYSFYQWVNTLGVIPLISALREKGFNIQAETMRSIENKIPGLTEKELKVIRKHTKSIVNQMMKDPILRLKEMATEPNAKDKMDFFKELFAIADEDITTNPIYEELKSTKQNKRKPIIASKITGLR